MAKKQKKSAGSIEKTLTLAGVALVVLGSVASIYYTVVNWRFVNSLVPDIFYYLNYLIVLGGGFAAGYLLTPKKGKNKDRLFNGAVYSLVAMALYFFVDIIRLVFRDLLHVFSVQMDNLTFEYAPLAALVVTVAIAWALQARTKKAALNSTAKQLLVWAFVVEQLCFLASQIYYNLVPPAGSEQLAMPMWTIVLSYLTHPVVLLVVAFFVLQNIKGMFLRLFYSTFIASLLYYLMLVLWNFRNDPTLEATNMFQLIVSVVVLLVAAGLLWTVRKAK